MKHCELYTGHSPVILTAIHDGHDVRRDLVPYFNLNEAERMREEDPYTDFLAEASDSRVVVRKSRFEADLNRPREKAVYRAPDDAWGLAVWKHPPMPPMIDESLVFYDTFYKTFRQYLLQIIRRHGHFLVLDIHTYNYRRVSPYDETPAIISPEINIGTGTLPPAWRFIADTTGRKLSLQTINGHRPDVRENVNFAGGHLTAWINAHFGAAGGALAIEFKKVFMDEWTGRVNIRHLHDMRSALAALVKTLTGKLPVKKITVRHPRPGTYTVR